MQLIIFNSSDYVFVGNVRTLISTDKPPQKSRDHLVEQLLPYSLWGSQYLAPSSPIREYNDMFEFVSKVNTMVIILPFRQYFANFVD